MAKISEVIGEIERYEREIDVLFKQNINIYSDKDRTAACLVLNDTIDLIHDIGRDIYMFTLAYENNNNTYTFMPQYYFENAILHIDMVWERLLMIIGINNQIVFENIFERKNVSSLFKDIKKNENVEKDIKDLLAEVNGDYKIKSLKIIRNGDVHGLSSHLNDSSEKKFTKENINEIYNLLDGRLLVGLKEVEEMTYRRNQEEMKTLSEKITDIKRVQSIYKRMMKKCIVSMGKAFKYEDFEFNEKGHFIPKEQYFFISPDLYDECYFIYENLKVNRTSFREVIDLVNSNVILSHHSKDVLRNNLLTDCLFRSTEIARTINIMLGYFTDESKDEKYRIYCQNEVLNPTYYFDHIIIKLYSVYEKLAKFILCKYDFEKKYVDEDSMRSMYIEDVIDSLTERNISTIITVGFRSCVESAEYKRYEEIRNKYYHCIRELYFLFSNNEEVIKYYLSNITTINKMLEKLQKLFSTIIREEKGIYKELGRKIEEMIE